MTEYRVAEAARTREIIFAGDGVRLAGQLDVPPQPAPADGYPLIFIVHHASAPTRADYAEVADIALAAGYAIFRWDRRGTGRSGGSGKGSTVQDAVKAYETALEQPDVDRARVVILAMGVGTALVGSSYGLFARVQRPLAALLISNQLDETEILAFDTRLLLVSGANDYHMPARYTAAVAKAHRRQYRHGADAFVVPGADRMLRTADDQLHPGVVKEISTWLSSLQAPSRST